MDADGFRGNGSVEDKQFAMFVDANFEKLWADVEEDYSKLEKRDLAKKMFVTGYVMCRESINNLVLQMEEDYKKNPEKFEQMIKDASKDFKK